MIGCFENKTAKTGYPVKNEIKSLFIRSLIITLPDFYFASVEDFEDRDEWISEIKSENIFPLNMIKEADNESEKQSYIKSSLGYEYGGRPGKYIFTIRMSYNKEYHDYINSWTGKDMRLFIADVNRGVLANLNGAQVRGLDVELFQVEKQQFGDKAPAWTQIRIVFIDSTEYNLYTSMDWNPSRFNLTFVTLSNISGTGNQVQFTIKDAIYGINISNLYIDDLALDDNAGAVNITALEELSCGVYKITADSSLTYGDILVDSDRFYGSGQYFIDEDTVILNNYAFESTQKFQVDIRLAGSLTLYGGLLTGDFTITDDTNGAATITDFTEVSIGRYEITTDIVLTTGDIDIDDGTVTGAGSYELSIEIEFYDISIDEPNTMTVSVREVVTGDPVTGLSGTDFDFDDTYNGTFSGLSEVESPAGTYELIVDGSLVDGDIDVNTLLLTGSGTYTNSEPTVQNAGASGATDWLNESGGIAERFSAVNGSLGYFDVTMSYPVLFTGNAQKIVKDVSTAGFIGIEGLLSNYKTGVDYKLRFKWILQPLTGYEFFGTIAITCYIYGSGESPIYLNNVAAGATNPMIAAEFFESDTFQITAGEDQAYISIRSYIAFSSLWIDEVELIEV